MFTERVNKLYIGKSKLKFTYSGKELDHTTLLETISEPVKSSGIYDPTYPDVQVRGYFYMNNIIELNIELPMEEEDAKSVILWVTGIPKEAKSIQPYKNPKAILSSYFEDAHHGYLFQLTKSPIQYGTNRIY